jgi:hypothetical protein
MLLPNDFIPSLTLATFTLMNFSITHLDDPAALTAFTLP